MARPDEGIRSRDGRPPRDDIRRNRFIMGTGAALLGYLWASVLVAVAGTESLLARLARRR
jgi:hypothetical protein